MRKLEKELLDKYHELEDQRDKLLNECDEYNGVVIKLTEKIIYLKEELASCKTQIDIYKKLLYGDLNSKTNCDIVVDGKLFKPVSVDSHVENGEPQTITATFTYYGKMDKEENGND